MISIIEFEQLTRPISESQPCGPDLDRAGDAEYMNFVARAEGLLPTSFFGSDGRAFDRSTIDSAAELTAIKPLLERTRDIRLLVILAKFLALTQNLPHFATCLAALEKLLADNWDEVHPGGEEDDIAIRLAVLETLDDLPTVVLPLQYTPLIHSRRLGALSYRNYLVAAGEIQAREGEDTHDLSAIESALAETSLETLVDTRGPFETLRSAATGIRKACLARADAEQVPRFERLLQNSGRIVAVLDGAIAKLDPTAASTVSTPDAASGPHPPPAHGQTAVTSTIPLGRIKSSQDAAAALSAVSDYFSRFEPSNPALLLVRQAEQLMGKSFLEIMRVLLPAHVEQATIVCGKEQGFELPIERLSAFASVAPANGSPEGAAAAPATPDSLAASPPVPPPLEARTRQDAIALLEQTGTYYRAVEPSSPVPFITDRARELAQRDFLSALKELLPESALRTIKGQ